MLSSCTRETKIEVIYNTYESNEIMLNNIKTGKTQYDLICPSDYTIQKMLNEDLLIKFDMNEDNLTYKNVENYNKYASPYIKELFIEKGWQEYSIPYMWGTMGIIYNIDTVENHEDMHTWLSLWDKEYYGSEESKIKANEIQSRSMIVIDFLREIISFIPQNRDTITDAPIPIPIQQM